MKRLSKVRSAVACHLVVIVTTLAGPAIAAPFRFLHLTVDEGLSQSTVQALAQDQAGFIWLGTQQGLNRYDGTHIHKFFHDPGNPDSLPSNWVWDVFTASDGRFWVGTQAGLAWYDPVTRRFTTLQLSAEDAGPRASIRVITEDAAGALWIGTDGNGLFRLDPASLTARQISRAEQDSSRMSDHIKALHVDGAGNVWIGSDAGLARLDPVRDVYTPIDLGAPELRVRALSASGSNRVWVGLTEEGLIEVDFAGWVTRRFRANSTPGLSSDSIRALHGFGEALWIGHDSHGLTLFDNATFTPVRHNSANVRSLVDDHVAEIFESRDGMLWVGTTSGVSRWNPTQPGFVNFSRRGEAEGQLSNNWVSSFAEAGPQTIWVGTAGGGVNLVDLNSGRTRTLRHDPDNANSLSEDRVHALLADREGALWAGTRAGGLNRLDPTGEIWTRYRHDPAKANSLSFDGVTSLLEDSADRVWVGTYMGGLNLYQPGTANFRRYQADPARPETACLNRLLTLFEDRTGALWLGSHQYGMCRFEPDENRFTAFRHEPGRTGSLSSDAIFGFVEDIAGNLWIATADAGVNLWPAAARAAGTERFTHFGAVHGMRSPTVYSLLSDGAGHLWLGGNQGLARLDPNLGRFRHFNVHDGLPGNEFNVSAALRTSAGGMLFGGTNGFTYFLPHEITPPNKAINVVLTGFYRLGREVTVDLAAKAPIQLGHADKFITFEYAALDFDAAHQTRYQHRLRGFDTGWIDDGRAARTSYTNLAPGDYVFEVRVAKETEDWASTALSVPLAIAPAPWATWWAYTLYAMVLLAGLVMVQREWSRRARLATHIKQVNAALVKEVADGQAKERALQAERRQAQRYLDVVEVIILALDDVGRITMINQKGARVLGAPEADIVGQDYAATYVPSEHQPQVREALANLEHYAYTESLIRGGQGPDRMVAWHSIRLPAEGAHPGGVLMSGTDVTQMRNLEKQLRDAQRMEALGALSRGVAHDFNNILSAVLGYAELSAGTLAPDHRAREYLQGLQDSVARARELIRSILTFGQGAQFSPKPTNMSTVVSEAIHLVRPLLPPNVVLREFVEADCGPVIADPSLIIQIVLNLSTNACQAMETDGGTLEIRVRNADLDVDQARAIGTLEPGRYVRLTVADTGPGMDDYTRSRIFEPFFTTRRQGEGTGLGLAVVHGGVAQLKGIIEVESAPGKGTTVDILLPRRGALQEVRKRESAPGRVSAAAGRLILFVDDEPNLVDIATEFLRNSGYDVISASNGEEALALIKDHARRFSLMITDQTMPDMRGEQLATRFKAANRGAPVVLVSGADHSLDDNVDLFLPKPFTRQELMNAVVEVLGDRSKA